MTSLLNQPDLTEYSPSTIPAMTLSGVVSMLGVLTAASRRPSSKHFKSRYEGNKDIEVELFTWEKLDYVDKVKAAFGL